MKYHNHEIKKVYENLGEERTCDNCYYEIYYNNEWLNNALTLSTAKEYIDSGHDERYL